MGGAGISALTLGNWAMQDVAMAAQAATNVVKKEADEKVAVIDFVDTMLFAFKVAG